MTNTLLFILIAVIDLSIVLFAWRLGKNWLVATILANIVLTSTFVGKLVPLFGLVTTGGEVFYASIFIATDILSEHHGKKLAYRSIWMGFLMLAMFVGLSQLVLLFNTVDETLSVHNAMATLFQIIPRLAVASFIAYLIAQRFDIWLFHFIREKTGKHKLWLRNNISTITSQLLDSLIFFPLAFFGTVSTEILLTLILTGWIFKIPVAILDTPIMYLSYVIKGKKPPDFGKKTPALSEAPAAGLQ
jgi:queuosine precursor transporter